jgi:hypothetical protein
LSIEVDGEVNRCLGCCALNACGTLRSHALLYQGAFRHLVCERRSPLSLQMGRYSS